MNNNQQDKTTGALAVFFTLFNPSDFSKSTVSCGVVLEQPANKQNKSTLIVPDRHKPQEPECLLIRDNATGEPVEVPKQNIILMFAGK